MIVLLGCAVVCCASCKYLQTDGMDRSGYIFCGWKKVAVHTV